MRLPLNSLFRPTRSSRIARFVAITTVFLITGGFLIERGHKAYWKTTIFQVQTVDFNILAHTLPTTLSLALLRKDWATIQKILDSNYSLFGLVVTDPEGKKILAMSNSKVVSDNFAWQRKLVEQPSFLQNHPYNYLVDPPPMTAQISYASPYVKDPEPLQKPHGKIIGRIYYIRGTPPSLIEDLQMWIPENFWAERDAFPLYSNTLLLTVSLLILTFLLAEIIVNLKQREYEQYEQILRDNQQLSERLSFERRLLSSLEGELSRAQQNLASLEAVQEESHQELNTIKEEKERLKRALEDISHDNQILIDRYNEIRRRERELLNQIEQSEQKIKEQERSIRSITEAKEQTQNTENRIIQQVRDIVCRNLPSSDEQNMTFELLRKIFEFGFIPRFDSDASQVFNPNDPFDRITRMLSRNFDQLQNVLRQLIRCIQERRDRLSYQFSRTDDRNCINNFFDLLRSRRIFYDLTRIPGEIVARINYDDQRFSDCYKFLRGGWLESYLCSKVRDFYRQRRIVCLSNLKFVTINEAGEFDLISFVDNQMIIFECKTGNYESFQEQIPKYVNRSAQLELSPRQFILVAPRLRLEQRRELSQRHNITFAGLDDLDTALEVAISA